MKSFGFLRKSAAAAIVLAAAMASSCSDDVKDDAYYTFTGQTVASFAADNTDTFSTFAALIEDTGTASLLSTYGHYTVFMPDDDAFAAYFRSIGKTYDSLTDDEKNEIVFNHIIQSGSVDYTSDTFEEGALAESTMSDNYIVISYKTDDSGAGLTIYVNKDVPIVERDIELHNGVVHRVGAVIEPTEEYPYDILLNPDVVGSNDFSLFARALSETHLADSLRKTYDETYVCPSPTGTATVSGWDNVMLPKVKRYGFTVFAENNAVMAQAGINSFEDLVQFARRYYDDGNPSDFTSRDNALNKFVAYHLLDRQMPTNSFLYNGPQTAPNSMRDREEFYETMYEFHIIKVNVGPVLNRSTRNKNNYIEIDEANSNFSAINGYVHGLKQMLVYDRDHMENDVLNCRIRFDMFNVPPELTNNNIRWQLSSLPAGTPAYSIPHDYCSKHISFSKETSIIMWASPYWDVHQEDEMKLDGWFDFTLRLIPVPPGSYEIRVGYRPESWRGIAQFFIDGQIQGIPRDQRIVGSDPQVGWIADTGTAQDAENDKAMRNRGFMKAPASMWSNHDNCTFRDIQQKQPLRMIIGTVSFQDYGAHYLRAKNVYSDDREYNGDYIELIPTSLIDTEDIY